MWIRTKARDIHKNGIFKVLTNIMYAFQHLVLRISRYRYILEYIPWRGRLVGKTPLYEPGEVPNLGSSRPQPAPAREWPWHSHHAITRSMGPYLRKYASLISVISRGRPTTHPPMVVGLIVVGTTPSIGDDIYWPTTWVDIQLSSI